MSSLLCSSVHFAWRDGAIVFDGLDTVVAEGRTALVGVNGSGKSTLLRLLAGELAPASGSVIVDGSLGYLPQDLTLASDLRVEDVLGVTATRAALAAIESGDVTDGNLAAVGDDWAVEERIRATLDRLRLSHVTVERTVGSLSGGEVVLLGLAAQLLREPDVLLLDEPTNNLDRDARSVVHETVRSWRGVLLVVSHDRELLELVDRVADLRDGDIRWYGGNFADYEEALAVEQEAAERTLRSAEGDLRKQQRELVDARIKLDRRKRYARKMWDSTREPRAVMKLRKRQAELSAGKHRNMHLEKVEEARDRLDEAEKAVRDDDTIRVELPATEVPRSREVLRLSQARLANGPTVSLDVRGPERIALLGKNGAGKTTLLRTLTGALDPVTGTVKRKAPLRYLPQRLDVLDDALTVAENVARFAPGASKNEIRARLARFLFRGARADQPVHTLSGGERFRASLAALLLAEPAPQLLLLDEPTNNLDLTSVQQLSDALSSYAGALIVASHDLPFLRTLQVTRWLELDGALTEVDEPPP